MQQRYYDPRIGRFWSVDPVTAYEQPITNFCRYCYARNNPYKFTDPDGRNGVAFLGGLATESWNAVNGRGFDGEMVMGALADGYNGEGGGALSAAIEDVSAIATVAGGAGILRLAAKQAGKQIAARANKIHHIFAQKRHSLGGLAKSMGGEAKAYGAIEKATLKAVDASKAGKFETVVKVGGENVTVRGSVVDGQVKIGTAFVKPPPPPPPPQVR